MNFKIALTFENFHQTNFPGDSDACCQRAGECEAGRRKGEEEERRRKEEEDRSKREQEEVKRREKAAAAHARERAEKKTLLRSKGEYFLAEARQNVAANDFTGARKARSNAARAFDQVQIQKTSAINSY